jgi:hypothetical protein
MKIPENFMKNVYFDMKVLGKYDENRGSKKGLRLKL